MATVNNDATATAPADQDTQTAATIAERILARRPLFKDATVSDTEADRLADAEEADLCALATAPGALAGKARVLLATNLLRHVSPSFGEWRVLESLLNELAAPVAAVI
jgi:hypothetical protein